MNVFYLIGIICFIIGIGILVRNFDNIIKDLKGDKFGNNIKFYGGAILLVGISIRARSRLAPAE
jgi:hypothetical protein